MRTGGRGFLVGALLLASCGGTATDSSPGPTPSTADSTEFCRQVVALEGTDPFAGLAEARTRADAEAVLAAAMARIRPLRETAPSRVSGRADRYVQAFEDFEELMRSSDFDPDPRDYADLQSRTTDARLAFAAAAEEVCGTDLVRPDGRDW
jgi:hypothetical protein